MVSAEQRVVVSQGLVIVTPKLQIVLITSGLRLALLTATDSNSGSKPFTNSNQPLLKSTLNNYHLIFFEEAVSVRECHFALIKLDGFILEIV